MMNTLHYYWMAYMDDIVTYLLATSLVLTLLYVPYTLLLRKERFFRQNRITLLAILMLSLVLPFCDVHALYAGDLLTGLFSKSMPASEAVVEFASNAPIATTTPLGPITFTEAHIRPLGIWPWLCYLYVAGTLIVLTIRLWQFVRMHRLIRKSCLWSDEEDGVIIHCHADDVAPCSWMHHIVISEHDYQYHRHEILLHEKGHVRSLHSWDILLLTLVQTIQWFNPFAYMLGASLRDIHEYEADDYVLRQGITASEYQTLLLKTAVDVSAYTFANNFNHRLIKNRIVMMKKQSISPWKRYKALYILPMAVVLLCAFATPGGSNPFNEGTPTANASREKVKISGKVIDASTGKALSGVNVLVRKPGNPRITAAAVSENGKFSLETYEGHVMTFSFVGMQDHSVIVPKGGAKSLTISMSKALLSLPDLTIVGYAPVTEETEDSSEEAQSNVDKGQPFTAVRVIELMPEYPGGMGECYRFLQQNVKYPTAASKAGIQGKVIVEFLVKEDGSIADIAIKQGVNPELNAEAMRVVSIMPKWKPGEQRGKPVAVRFEFPIEFRLQ